MRCSVVVAAPPVAALKPKSAAEVAEIRRWIDNLSHPSADLRQIATRKLVQAGRPALPVVVAAINHDNPETAARARLILLRMCLSKDFHASKAAVDAVTQLAENKPLPLRRWSHELLERLRLTAEATLKEGGVAVTSTIDEKGHVLARVDMSKWKGRDGSLVTLRFLGRIGRIDLSNAKINDNSLEWLQEHRTIHTLELRSTEISDRGLRHLAALSELTELDLRETRVSGKGLKHLQHLRKLESLHLGGETHLFDGGLRDLPNAAGLKYLNLSTAKLADGDLSSIKQCTSLEQLWISYTDVGDAGMKNLNGLQKLQVLSLSGTKVTDAGLKSLHDLKSLKKVWLRRTAVTSRGVKALEEQIPGLQIRY